MASSKKPLAARVIEHARTPMMTLWNITDQAKAGPRILLLYGKSVRPGSSIKVPTTVTSAQGGLLAGLISDNLIYIGDDPPRQSSEIVPRARVRGSRTH